MSFSETLATFMLNLALVSQSGKKRLKPVHDFTLVQHKKNKMLLKGKGIRATFTPVLCEDELLSEYNVLDRPLLTVSETKPPLKSHEKAAHLNVQMSQ